MTPRVCYALCSLVALWAFGGGDAQLFWNRQWLLAPLVLAAGFVGIFLTGQIEKLFASTEHVKKGLMIGLISALPFVALIFMAHKSAGLPDWIITSINNSKVPSFLGVFLGAFLLAPGWELVSRGLLQPVWGLGSVAFLDAITIGFGSQTLLPFAVLWAMGLFWGWIRVRFSLHSAVLAHVTWSFLVLSMLAL